MTSHHVVLLLSLFDKIVILRRVESTCIWNSIWWMSNLGLLICRWDLVVLVLDHTLHIFCYDVIFTYHWLLLVGLLTCHCTTIATERIVCLLSALWMLARILKISVECVLMRTSSHAQVLISTSNTHLTLVGGFSMLWILVKWLVRMNFRLLALLY